MRKSRFTEKQIVTALRQTEADHFYEASALTPRRMERLQNPIRSRVLRHCRRNNLLEPHEGKDMLRWDHGAGFSPDASVRIVRGESKFPPVEAVPK